MISFDAGGTWENVDGLADGIWEELKPRAENVMRDAGTMCVSTVKQTLTGARSGRSYKVSKTGRQHVASAPGEPPAVLFGHLRNSVGHSKPRWAGGEIAFDFGPGLGTRDDNKIAATYSMRLEYGGADSRGVMIEARPYMQPSADKLEPLLEHLFEGAL